MTKYFLKVGQKFNRLTIAAQGKPTRFGQSRWSCRCDCGNDVDVIPSVLATGGTKSCGCFRVEVTMARSLRHGFKRVGSKSREYRSWQEAKQRCINPHKKSWSDYGGRGISMSPKWFHSFPQFLKDMGFCPPGLTLDRLNNEKGYEPENCRWASQQDQANNTRANRILEWRGKRLTCAQWDREMGFKPLTVTRCVHLGWSVERIFTQRVIRKPRRI